MRSAERQSKALKARFAKPTCYEGRTAIVRDFVGFTLTFELACFLARLETQSFSCFRDDAGSSVNKIPARPLSSAQITSPRPSTRNSVPGIMKRSGMRVGGNGSDAWTDNPRSFRSSTSAGVGHKSPKAQVLDTSPQTANRRGIPSAAWQSGDGPVA